MPVRKPPRKLFDLSLEKFAFHFISTMGNIDDEVSSSSRFGSNSFSSKTHTLSNIVSNICYQYSFQSEKSVLLVPPILLNKILTEVLQLLGTMQISSEAPVLFLLRKLFTFFMTDKLWHLDLNPLIRFLKLRSVYIRPVIASVIGSAENLVSFTLTIMCDDNILYTMSKNCSQLKYLNIANSELVTDSGVSALAPSPEFLGCGKLQTLIIYGCPVSVHVVCSLLKSLLDIEYIGYSKMHEVLVEIIKQRDENKVGTTAALKLRKLTAYENPIARHRDLLLPDFGTLCPGLQCLDICTSNNKSIACLKHLPPISQLFLVNRVERARFLTPVLCEYFSTNASKLTSLTVSCESFNLPHLLCLGRCCPNISELHVSCVYLHCDGNFKIGDEGESYKMLSVFIFEHICFDEGKSSMLLDIICSVLKNTKVLKRLSLIERKIMTDQSFQDLLSCVYTDSLLDLNVGKTSFNEGKSIRMTMNSVHYVLDKCLALKSLSGLDEWEVDMLEIEELEKDLIASNYDIELSGSFVDFSLR